MTNTDDLGDLIFRTQSCTISNIADLFGLTERRIQQLAKDGVIPKPKHGNYELIGSVQGYIKFLRNAVEKQGSGTTNEAIKAAREKLITEQTAGHAIKNAVSRSELAPVALLEWALASVAQQIGSILDAIPLKVKNKNPSLKASDIDLIRREIVRAQNAAAAAKLDFSKIE